MADERNKLRATLDQLHAQLDEMRKLNPEVAAQLDATIGEAKDVLDGRRVETAAGRSIVKRLVDAVQRYEASHPSLAANLGGVADALARMGI